MRLREPTWLRPSHFLEKPRYARVFLRRSIHCHVHFNGWTIRSHRPGLLKWAHCFQVGAELGELIRKAQPMYGGLFEERENAIWQEAEAKIFSALTSYGELSELGEQYQRRLFARDAARGIGFIDLLRQEYDAVLMNPPFGEVAIGSREYLYARYDNAAQDIYYACRCRFQRA